MEQKKESKIKKLRNFIKSHEIWYFVDDTYSQVSIKKAYRVKLESGDYWIHLAYGENIHRLTARQEKLLSRTMAEAQEKAGQIRKERAEEAIRKKKEKKEKLKEVTRYLDNFRVWDIINYNTQEIKPEYKAFVVAIKYIYDRLPDKHKDDKDTYIKLLEYYIKHGTIHAQGVSFTKEQVVSVVHGEYERLRVELSNGMKITPASENVRNLITLLFGGNDGGWVWRDVEYIEDGRDRVSE